jgi:hypothetical protein
MIRLCLLKSFLVLILLLSDIHLSAQEEKYVLKAGLAYMEGAYIGAEFRTRQTNSFGFSVGQLLFENFLTTGITHRYFFGISRKYYDRFTWNISQSVYYVFSPYERGREQFLIPIFMIGRRLLFSERLFLNMDAGVGLTIETVENPDYIEGSSIIPLPNLNIQICYRFK